jgi:hypothetical protein
VRGQSANRAAGRGHGRADSRSRQSSSSEGLRKGGGDDIGTENDEAPARDEPPSNQDVRRTNDDIEMLQSDAGQSRNRVESPHDPHAGGPVQ